MKEWESGMAEWRGHRTRESFRRKYGRSLGTSRKPIHPHGRAASGCRRRAGKRQSLPRVSRSMQEEWGAGVSQWVARREVERVNRRFRNALGLDRDYSTDEWRELHQEWQDRALMAKASKWLRHSKTEKTRSLAKRRMVASVRKSVERSVTLRGLRISERQADRKKHAPKAKPERERQASAGHFAAEASGEEAYTSDAPEEAIEEKQIYASRDGKRRKRTLLGFLFRVVAPACLLLLLLLYLFDRLNKEQGWGIPLELGLAELFSDSPDQEQEEAPIDFRPKYLSRSDANQLGAHASFAANFTLDGNRLATHDRSGNGNVRIWNISSDGNLSQERNISSPHTTRPEPTFGESIVMAGNFLGIGSGLACVKSEHDGRFYLYDLSNGSHKTNFNVSPHRAQYFGRYSAYANGVLAVGESGNPGWETDAAVTFYQVDSFSVTQIKHYVHPGIYSYNGGVTANGDYFVIQITDPEGRHLLVKKVVRDKAGKPLKIEKFAEIEEKGENTISGSSSTNGKFIAIGVAGSSLRNVKSGAVTLLKIEEEGKLTKIDVFAPKDAAAGMAFGSAVAFSGNVLLVGSSGAKNDTKGKGKVYAYEIKEDGTRQLIASFYPESMEAKETFGTFLSISGNRVAVAAGTSVIYLYELSGIGSIDDLRIYDRTLSAAEVATLYNHEKPAAPADNQSGLLAPVFLPQGLVAYYPFDGNASDMSGNGHHGTVNGATLGKDRDGVEGKAYHFEGNDSITNDTDFFSNKSFSLSLHYKTTGHFIFRHAFKRPPLRNHYLHIGFRPGVRTGMSRDYLKSLYMGWWYNELESKFIKKEGWNHGVFLYDKQTGARKIFHSGKLVAQDKSKSHYLGTGGLALGKDCSPISLDEVRIYDRALSAAEVATLYNHEKPVAAKSTPYTVPSVSLDMLWCPPGTFMMGSPESETERHSNERQHAVTLTQGFWLGKHEVTQAQWEKVMGNNPSHFKGANLPVEKVSWNDAVSFCKKLTERERKAGHLPSGYAYQLPTEAQWEYACRAETKTAYAFGDTITNEQANFSRFTLTNTQARDRQYIGKRVGSYPANEWGFHDMHGNVWEWCADWRGVYPPSAVSDPVGPADDGLNRRMNRGGAWRNPANTARSAHRGMNDPAFGNNNQGFRLSLRLASK